VVHENLLTPVLAKRTKTHRPNVFWPGGIGLRYSGSKIPRRRLVAAAPIDSRATAEDDARSRNNLLGHADALN
jgi:hypothetical protein